MQRDERAVDSRTAEQRASVVIWTVRVELACGIDFSCHPARDAARLLADAGETEPPRRARGVQ